ncbi:MAG: hypothetical protein GF390_03195 [Candidatus Pacebacteria bacterium]|nr:hypothetical protein [Candidatus Paceibacterota bacterium]
MKKFLLAIDGGATKTQVLAADLQGQVLGQGEAGSTNLAVLNEHQVQLNLRQAIDQAIKPLPWQAKFKTLVMGLAGVDSPAELTQAKNLFAQLFKNLEVETVRLENDTAIALASGTDKADALVLIAGTGSNCIGHNAQGQRAKTGGMDYLLTDEGSAYAVGRAGLRAAVRSFDGRGAKSLLQELVKEYFDLDTFVDLKKEVYQPPLSKTQIASLSVLVSQAVAQGDQAAQEIIDEAVQELVLMVKVVMTKLDLATKPVDLVLVGGMLKQTYLRQQLLTKLQLLNDHLKIIVPTKPPVYGALKLALKS